MIRHPLPQRRAAETFDLRFWNQPFTVTVGFYAEVFIDSRKTGGDVEAVARDAAAVQLSFGLRRQHRSHPARRHAQWILRRGGIDHRRGFRRRRGGELK